MLNCTCCPSPGRRRLLGALAAFAGTAVAGQSAVALDNARMHESLLARVGLERDLQTAKTVQHSFLPKSMSS